MNAKQRLASQFEDLSQTTERFESYFDICGRIFRILSTHPQIPETDLSYFFAATRLDVPTDPASTFYFVGDTQFHFQKAGPDFLLAGDFDTDSITDCVTVWYIFHKFAIAALEEDSIFFTHASVACNSSTGRSFLFSGPSGSGKTTLGLYGSLNHGLQVLCNERAYFRVREDICLYSGGHQGRINVGAIERFQLDHPDFQYRPLTDGHDDFSSYKLFDFSPVAIEGPVQHAQLTIVFPQVIDEPFWCSEVTDDEARDQLYLEGFLNCFPRMIERERFLGKAFVREEVEEIARYRAFGELVRQADRCVRLRGSPKKIYQYLLADGESGVADNGND